MVYIFFGIVSRDCDFSCDALDYFLKKINRLCYLSDEILWVEWNKLCFSKSLGTIVVRLYQNENTAGTNTKYVFWGYWNEETHQWGTWMILCLGQSFYLFRVIEKDWLPPKVYSTCSFLNVLKFIGVTSWEKVTCCFLVLTFMHEWLINY